MTSCGGAQSSRAVSARAKNGDAESEKAKANERSFPFAIQIGHAADVYCAAFSPDGTLVATGDHAGTIQIWDPTTGEVHAELVGHTANVTSLAFSHDGNRLASGGEDGRAFVWDLTRGARLSVVEVPNRKIWSVALSPTGEVLVVRDNVGLSLRRAVDGHEIRSYDHSNAPGVVLSPNGASVVVGLGTSPQIVDVVTGKEIATLTLEQPSRQILFSRDGRTVVTAGGESHKVTLFDATNGVKTREITTSGRVVAVAMDDKATIVAAALENQGVEIFDAQSGTQVSTIDAKRTSEWHFGMTADGKRVFASASATSIEVFDTHSGRILGTTHVDGLRRFVLDDVRGRIAGLRDHDPTVGIWDGSHNIATLEGAPEHVHWAGVMPDERALVVVEEDSPDFVVFDLATASIRTTLHTSLNHMYEALPSFDAAHFIALGYGESEILDARTGAEEKKLTAPNWSSQHQAAWSPTGELAFAGSDDHTLLRFGKKLEPKPPIEVGSPMPTSLAYSPDGSALAMAGPSGVVVMDADGKKMQLTGAFGQPAYGLAWSRDQQRIVVATEKNLFTIAVPSPLFSIRGEGAPPIPTTELDANHAFVATAFSPDGEHIAGGERGGVIDFFTEDRAEKSFHTHGTPWSVSFLSGAHAPVALVAATSLGLVRLRDGATIRLRKFMLDGHWVGLASGLGGVDGDKAALARVKMRSTPDVRSKIIPIDPKAIRPGLALELGR